MKTLNTEMPPDSKIKTAKGHVVGPTLNYRQHAIRCIFPPMPSMHTQDPATGKVVPVILYEREMGKEMGETLRKIKTLYNILRARYASLWSSAKMQLGEQYASIGFPLGVRGLFFDAHREIVSAMIKMYKYVIEEQGGDERQGEMPTFQEIENIVRKIEEIEDYCSKLQQPMLSMRLLCQKYVLAQKK